MSQIRNIAEKAGRGVPTTSQADSVRMWKWVKENLNPRKVIDPRFQVGDLRRQRWMYKNPDEKLISKFNNEARFRINPEMVRRMKKIWLSKNPIKGGEFDGKTLREVLNAGKIHTTMWNDVNKTLNTDYTPHQISRALRHIVRGMQGVGRPETRFVQPNKEAGDKLLKIFQKAKWGNPLSDEYRALVFETIDQHLGRDTGTHRRWVDRLKRVLKTADIPLWTRRNP